MWFLLVFNYFSTGKNQPASGKVPNEISQQSSYDVKNNTLVATKDKVNPKLGKENAMQELTLIHAQSSTRVPASQTSPRKSNGRHEALWRG